MNSFFNKRHKKGRIIIVAEAPRWTRSCAGVGREACSQTTLDGGVQNASDMMKRIMAEQRTTQWKTKGSFV